MKYLFIASLTFFIIPVALVIFKTGEKSKKESSTGKWMTYVYSVISIVATFGIGISASYYGFEHFNTEYALPLIVNCILTFITISLILSICGLAIGFIVPTTNKNLAYAIILCSFLCLGLGATIHYYRGDNFDPKTGESLVWITPSTGKRWYNKPKDIKSNSKTEKKHRKPWYNKSKDFKFDPRTGERLRQATSDDFIEKGEKKQKSWKTVFEKEFIGVGFTGGKDKDGCIYTAMNGRDYFYGDKIIIEGVNAQVWYDGGWQNTEDGKFQYINKSNKSKSQTAVRTKKGEIIIITIKRFM